jgi:hypothetical protein
MIAARGPVTAELVPSRRYPQCPPAEPMRLQNLLQTTLDIEMYQLRAPGKKLLLFGEGPDLKVAKSSIRTGIILGVVLEWR